MICGFCRKPFTPKMVVDYSSSMGSVETGPYGEEVCIEIYCEHCKKLIYKKEGSVYDFD